MKWEITDAAEKRIQKRIAVHLKAADIDPNPWDILLEAMRPEDYANKREQAEKLAQRWIKDSEMPWLTAHCFRIACRDLRETREAGRNLMNGIRQMGRLKL